MVRFFRLSAEDVTAAWEDLEPVLQRFVLCGSDLTLQEIKTHTAAERQQIWGLQDDFEVHTLAITEILQTSRGLICLIVGACSNKVPKPLMERLHDEIGRWAQGLGCVAIRIHGRKGWLRWDRRYKQTAIVAERPL